MEDQHAGHDPRGRSFSRTRSNFQERGSELGVDVEGMGREGERKIALRAWGRDLPEISSKQGVPDKEGTEGKRVPEDRTPRQK